MNVVVIGGGVVGLATAYELTLEGHSVHVMESRPAVAQGASGGNGAQLSYSYVQPLADPTVWSQLPKLLFKTDSPLRFNPSLDPHQWRWLVQFMSACTRAQSQRGTKTLLELGVVSRQRFESMMQQLRIAADSCSYNVNGKLVLYRTNESFRSSLKQLDFQSSLGLGGQQFSLTGEQAADLEPSLLESSSFIAGAVHTPSEAVVDCQKLCDALVEKLSELGVRFSTNATVEDLRKMAASDTQTHWVICAGAQSYELLQSMDVRVPVYPIKGYSVTLPVARTRQLGLSITDASRKIVFAPLNSLSSCSIRVAGYAELVGMNRDVDTTKIREMLKVTKTVFPSLHSDVDSIKDLAQIFPWAGLRPATPTGIPIIGRLPNLPNNVMVNIGHGALGLTLAFGTAYKLALAMRKPAGPL
jgi:D-amino-acid dehydrogenase